MRTTEERKEVIRLYTEEQYGYKYIAKETNISRSTVKTWIKRYRNENGLLLCGHPGQPPNMPVYYKSRTPQGFEKRIKQLEMEVELLRDFLSEEERRSIKK